MWNGGQLAVRGVILGKRLGPHWESGPFEREILGENRISILGNGGWRGRAFGGAPAAALI